jgi:hypothetical protein
MKKREQLIIGNGINTLSLRGIAILPSLRGTAILPSLRGIAILPSLRGAIATKQSQKCDCFAPSGLAMTASFRHCEKARSADEAIPLLSGFIMTLAAILLITTSPARAQVVIDNMTVAPCPECSAGTNGLPKTGQETSYATNDDADYADPISEDIGYTRGEGSWANWNADGGRFTKASGSPPESGTVTDNATGLEWIANPTDAGLGSTYDWATALANCEGLTNYAGHSDWRLPNIKELMSIVDYGTYSPSIDTTFFTSQSDYYWSSTTYANDTAYAWYVTFDVGYTTYNYGKTSAGYVRCVRAGQ